MSEPYSYLAIDLGAESGRVMLGCLRDGRLELAEAHRFANGPVSQADGLHWDVRRLWQEIKTGLRSASSQACGLPSGIGLDTWGVDYALLDEQDCLVEDPFHYRDARTNGMMERAFARVPRQEIYARTGIQFMQLNSLYQLLAQAGSPQLARARSLLFIPDLFNFWLSGVKANEYTIASTSQCLDPYRRTWDAQLLQRLGLPASIFGNILPPGTVLGALLPQVAAETGCAGVPLVAVGSHDTASAVAGVPAATADFIYISSGTWSLMGTEIRQPVINARSLECNLTNEGGVYGTIRLLKNIMGMWLLQECRREWAAAGQKYSYDELTAQAAAAAPFGPHIRPNDDRFLAPGRMVGRIQQFCVESGQAVPQSVGEIVRCILESLALEYRRVVGQLEALSGKRAGAIHIVGGGSRNTLLNQLTADCTGRAVVAGPVEATAIGNILVQAIALGHIPNLQAGREVVRASFTPQTYNPTPSADWDEAYDRFISK